VRRYPDTGFLIECDEFKRMAGEAAVGDMQTAEIDAYFESLGADDQHDYIQESSFGKALALFLVSNLKQANFSVMETYASDHAHHIVVNSTDGTTLEVFCVNHQCEGDTDDGTVHLIQVRANPSLRARIFRNAGLIQLMQSVTTEIERVIVQTPTIKLLERY
jgi:hypothetical protein